FFSSRRRHTRSKRDWSSDVCSSDLLSIVLFHELGHYGAAKFFKWRIKGIMLWIFGGVMDTDEHGNKPFHEDIIVTVAGPLQHLRSEERRVGKECRSRVGKKY